MANQTSLKMKAARRLRRKRHIRRRLFGDAGRPRLSVFRSLSHTYAQVIDDSSARTLCSAGTVEKALRSPGAGGGKKAAAEAVGRTVAERARALGITRVVFDRNAFRYHGRIKALADAARAAGLEF
jgi:large subunit ribosomal protein L18